jgi:hypothetical protein
MATLSRTKKYQELRDRLQHDTTTDSFSTNDLSRFEKRLNEIDAQNFSYEENKSQESYNAGHARNLDVQPAKESEPLHRKQAQPDFNTSYYSNENDATFDNDYLNQYIREVKQYNIDQGNAASENTSLNILKQIERNNSKTPDRPYPRSNNQTMDIPFLNKQETKPSNYEPVSQPVQETEPTQPLTKEDIMAEVQNLVNGTDNPLPSQQEKPQSSPFVSDNYENTMGTDTFSARLEADRTTRQQLLNETTQMRAQLDDYEDNLSEFSDKMRQTNKVLNTVLVILIIVLAIIVGFVIYWIVISK